MIEAQRIAALAGHQNSIYTLESEGESEFFYTGGNDKGVVQWSLSSLSPVKVLMPVRSSVYALHIPSSNRDVMAVGERSGQISLFGFAEQKVIASFQKHIKPIFALHSVNRKQELLAASEDGSISVIDLQKNELIYNFRVADDVVRCIAISPDESMVALGCKDNIIRLYHTEDYALFKELSGHTLGVTSLCFSPDGRTLFSGGRDARLNAWDTTAFELREGITAHMQTVYDIRFHRSKALFATCSQDKSIKIWNADTLKLQKVISRERGFESHSHSINKLSWNTPDGSLISVSDDRMVMLWGVREL